MKSHVEKLEFLDNALSASQRIDSYVRNGQFVNAHREIGKLVSEIESDAGEDPEIGEMLMYLRRTDAFLQDAINAYCENQRVMEICRDGRRNVLKKIGEEN